MTLDNAKYELRNPPAITWRLLSGETVAVMLVAVTLWLLAE